MGLSAWNARTGARMASFAKRHPWRYAAILGVILGGFTLLLGSIRGAGFPFELLKAVLVGGFFFAIWGFALSRGWFPVDRWAGQDDTKRRREH
jgi:hypothetical protein